MNRALAVIPKVWKKTFYTMTRRGKMDKLKQRNKLLDSNTVLVERKYEELTSIELKVGAQLRRLEDDKFENEIGVIDALENLPESERDKFKTALFEIRQHGLEELHPITVTAQRIKAHMLVTLNKANIQKAILESKTSLASNAVTQLETLTLLDKETKGISNELVSLLQDLDRLNTEALSEYSAVCETMKSITGKTSEDIIGHIANKSKVLGETKEKLEKVANDTSIIDETT